MTDWSGRRVIRGFAEEYLDRLPEGAVSGPPREAWGSRDAATAAWWQLRTSAFHGIVTYAPTCDPEWMKLTAQEMVLHVLLAQGAFLHDRVPLQDKAFVHDHDHDQALVHDQALGKAAE